MGERPSRASALKAKDAIKSLNTVPPKQEKVIKVAVRKSNKRKHNEIETPKLEDGPKSEDIQKSEDNPKLEDNDEQYVELPHNMGRVRKGTGSSKQKIQPGAVKDEDPDTQAAKGGHWPMLKKYKYTPGQTPFPNRVEPLADDCFEVNRLLTELHGKHEAPAVFPKPSLTVSGCGEVPSILDALVRTVISAATARKNSARALQGLVTRFGVQEDGIGKGSVNWAAVHAASQADVEKSISSGGLSKKKAEAIKMILQAVAEKNKARPDCKDPLSLDYLHNESNETFFETMLEFPLVGLKTTSCVMLFCLRRPSFAVDTHVHRISKWLGWVPQGTSAEHTFMHCDVRVPDELKYSLHQLMIKHGQQCGRCRVPKMPEDSEAWQNGCPLEGFITRVYKERMPRAKKPKDEDEGGDEDAEDSDFKKPKKKAAKGAGKGKGKGKKATKVKDEAELSEPEPTEDIQPPERGGGRKAAVTKTKAKTGE